MKVEWKYGQGIGFFLAVKYNNRILINQFWTTT